MWSTSAPGEVPQGIKPIAALIAAADGIVTTLAAETFAHDSSVVATACSIAPFPGFRAWSAHSMLAAFSSPSVRAASGDDALAIGHWKVQSNSFRWDLVVGARVRGCASAVCFDCALFSREGAGS
jgi:hypothetical protein